MFFKRYSSYLLLLFIGTGIFAYIFHATQTPVIPSTEGQKVKRINFTVKRGWTVSEISHRLEDLNLVKNWWAISLPMWWRGIDTDLITGTYDLSPSLSANEILSEFIKREAGLYKIVVEPGSTVDEVLTQIVSTGLFTKDMLQNVTTDRELLARSGVPLVGLEGYLFPGTYNFQKPVIPVQVLITMIKKGEQYSNTEDYLSSARNLQMSRHQAIVLASIIQKESLNNSEMNMISSVYHNRLRRNIPLESNATVCYQNPLCQGQITKMAKSLMTESNTYFHYGLPPTPISNPGEQALRAAVEPADTEYLYFEKKDERSHHFSSTYAEHKEALGVSSKKSGNNS